MNLQLALTSSLAVTCAAFSAQTNMGKLSIDHVVYVVPSLEEAIDDLEEKTGVRAAIGGRHLGLGTHNAFLSLGNGAYLELFAPDPEAEVPMVSIIGVDGPKPKISTFCCDAGSVGLDDLVENFKSIEDSEVKSMLPLSVESGSRKNADDGTTVSWRIAVEKHSVPAEKLPMGGLLPFYIDWGESRGVRPATTAPTGCTLTKLEACHPEPNQLINAIETISTGLGELLDVKEGPETKFIATLETPKGTVHLS